MIAPENISQVLDAARIEEVIGDFVYLKKAGANYKGLSPFKQEKTPSFVVSPSKQIFKCFSTGKGGNVFSFLMEHEQMSYPEAIRFVAKRYNIELEETERSPEQLAEQTRKESLSLIMKFADAYFQEQLWHSDYGKSIALTYLKNRGISDENIQKFGLGWCPESGDGLLKAAEEKGFNPQYLEDLGLVKNYGHKRRDFYTGRVIFPIYSISGAPIAFAGRTLHKDSKAPKYINSPETELYHKSKILYAMHQARSTVAKEELCFITEGYTDVMALHQAGVNNVVASAGTALTPEQAYLLKRYTKSVCLLYDGDGAGVKATLRGIDVLLGEGLTVYVCNLPAEHDPDSFAKSRSAEDLKNYLYQEKKDFVSYKAKLYLADEKDPIKRADGIREIVKSVALVEDAILRDLYIKQCAADYAIDQATLLQEVAKIKRAALLKRDGKGVTAKKADFADANPFDPAQEESPIPVKEDAIEPLEAELLRLILLYGKETFVLKTAIDESRIEESEHQVAEFILDILNIEEVEFTSPAHQELLALFKERPNLPQNELMAACKPSTQNLISKWLYNPHEISENWKSRHDIAVLDESERLNKVVPETMYAYLLQIVRSVLKSNEEKLSQTDDFEEITRLLSIQKRYLQAKKAYSQILHRVILHQ